ncbi:adenylate/guanylate cyclase domain-containing protein [Paenibacillus turpanensis]|uniref:adenylate/guanylate cyclase domain-containing protein n=1 Tax=Paenibacillus turpanensis TaxID=2689078 RepID=UPI00140C210E|nr:adenylate/guanylate cyclase domain-containing protein [Paenibacillus turpanensis]
MGLPVQSFTYTKTVNYPIDTMWELLSDTDHLNRVIGLFSIQNVPVQPGEEHGMFRAIRAKVAGIVPIAWDEHPFEWKQQEFYHVVRNYKTGPIQRFVGGVRLQDRTSDRGSVCTEVTLFADFTPRGLLGLAAIYATGVSSMKRTLEYIERFVQLREEQPQRTVLPQPKEGYGFDQAALERQLLSLRKQSVSEKVSERMKEWIALGGDDDVVDMRPYRLAKLWKLEKDEVLRWFLYATKEGIVNLSWNLLCPNCRVVKSSVNTMSALKNAFHCDFCGIDYDLQFDRNVELCFTVHPQIRPAFKNTFCIGGPMITPHIREQRRITPGSSAHFTAPTAMDRPYRLRTLQTNHKLLLETALYPLGTVEQAAPLPERSIVYSEVGFEANQLLLVPLETSNIEVKNHGDRDIVVALEALQPSDDIVTAAEAAAFAEFRRLFSSEVLAPGLQVGVENVTIWFSDLLDSTLFYEQVGDASAYGTVHKHFTFVDDAVRKHKGSVVKTIGDAVMAVFIKPEDAMRCSLFIMRGLKAFNTVHSRNAPLAMKLGFHFGPAIAVGMNDRLDYFGRTVNMAARIQALGGKGEIVVSREAFERDEFARILNEGNAEVQGFTAAMKGFAEQAQLARIVCRDCESD